MKFDKRLLFNRIKLVLGVEKDVDLAKFLGITPQTLANCIIRNSVDWDNMLSKCEFINIDFLLTGEGDMLKISKKTKQNDGKYDENEDKNLLLSLQKQNDILTSQIHEKDAQINQLLSILSSKK